MFIQITETMFKDAFVRANRKENFSHEALGLLFDYFEELEEQGEQIELDVIAICCEYEEASADDIIENYSIDVDEDADEDERADAVREFLEWNTCLVGETSAGFVFAQF